MALLVDIEKDYGSFRLKTAFEAGNETLAFLGASGCGKSLTLKCIAGIEKPDRGRIVLDDQVLFDAEKKINVPPQKRHVGLLFQNYALFPNMTVYQNIYAGTGREKDKALRDKMTLELMERFSISSLSGHYPHQLSGGQQQRTAIARILASKPKVLLMDEPFSALDSFLRFRMEETVREVIRSFGKTVLWVSHDRDEVFRQADRIAIMDRGGIDVIGTKHEVFADPVTRNAAMMTGCKNISAAQILEKSGEVMKIRAGEWGIDLIVPATGRPVTDAGIRMHDIRVKDADGAKENTFRCRVRDVIENPFSFTVMIEPMGADAKEPIGVVVSKEAWHNRDNKEEMTVQIPAEAVLLLESGKRA